MELMKMTLVAIKPGSSKLNMVKAIKFATTMGLKDAKEWVENLSIGVPEALTIQIPNEKFQTFEEFRTAVAESGYDLLMEDKIKKRQIKLIELGLGDKSDSIDLLSEELTGKLLFMTKNKSEQSLYTVYNDFFQDFLLNLEKEQLDKLLKINQQHD